MQESIILTSAIFPASSKIRRTSGLRSVPLEIQRAGSVPLHDQNFRYVPDRDCHWTTGSIVEMFAQVEQHHIVKTGIAPVAVRAQ